ncbi:MAG: hypothetical protein R3332_00365 [Pseudohongiellaceae bacterium]|nr:hypothetical protein [Pseudohongiellaceae bacterium]
MSWAWNKTAKRQVENPDSAPRKSKSTGVKHISPTVSGFTHAKPCKSEAMGARLNLHGSNLGVGGGGGKGEALTPGEIAAGAYAMNKRPPKVLFEIFSYDTTGRKAAEAVEQLSYFKHTLDPATGEKLVLTVIHILVHQAVKDGWYKDTRGRGKGFLRNMVVIAMDDICHPAKYSQSSAREWSRKLLLDNHQSWQRTWSSRYLRFRGILQEMDFCGEETLRSI